MIATAPRNEHRDSGHPQYLRRGTSGVQFPIRMTKHISVQEPSLANGWTTCPIAEGQQPNAQLSDRAQAPKVLTDALLS